MSEGNPTAARHWMEATLYVACDCLDATVYAERDDFPCPLALPPAPFDVTWSTLIDGDTEIEGYTWDADAKRWRLMARFEDYLSFSKEDAAALLRRDGWTVTKTEAGGLQADLDAERREREASNGE